jgi:hypothetical protein
MVNVPANPPPDVDEEARTAFFYTLGVCVTRWAYVDRKLFELYHWALKADIDRAAILYYKDRTLTSRLQNVDALARFSITYEIIRSEWDSLKKENTVALTNS